jgi:hypothetical protein
VLECLFRANIYHFVDASVYADVCLLAVKLLTDPLVRPH